MKRTHIQHDTTPLIYEGTLMKKDASASLTRPTFNKNFLVSLLLHYYTILHLKFTIQDDINGSVKNVY